MNLPGGFQPQDFSPRNDPDGELAKRIHEVTGKWPEGSRQHWEEKRREQERRHAPFDFAAHPSLSQPRSFEESMMQQLRLDSRRFGAEMRIGQYVLESAQFHQRVVEEAYGDLIVGLTARMLGENLPREAVHDERVVKNVTVHYGPATWRDFWKLTHGHRWWARWWVKRHPARVIEHPQTSRWTARAELTLDKWRGYPQADIRVEDKLGKSVIMVAVAEPAIWDWSQQS